MLALRFSGGLVDDESHTSKAPSLFLVCCMLKQVDCSANETNGGEGQYLFEKLQLPSNAMILSESRSALEVFLGMGNC